jgi:AbrB family looped-hinge helix DNA binding protein
VEAARTRLTSKGQLTVPKSIRDRLGLEPGDEIEIAEDDGKFVLRKVVEESPFEKWIGYLTNLEGQDPDELVEEMRGR